LEALFLRYTLTCIPGETLPLGATLEAGQVRKAIYRAISNVTAGLKLAAGSADKMRRALESVCKRMNKQTKQNMVRYLKFRVVDKEGFIVPIGKNTKSHSLTSLPVTKSLTLSEKRPPQNPV
jgi:hypothetical protein